MFFFGLDEFMGVKFTRLTVRELDLSTVPGRSYSCRYDDKLCKICICTWSTGVTPEACNVLDVSHRTAPTRQHELDRTYPPERFTSPSKCGSMLCPILR